MMDLTDTHLSKDSAVLEQAVDALDGVGENQLTASSGYKNQLADLKKFRARHTLQVVKVASSFKKHESVNECHPDRSLRKKGFVGASAFFSRVLHEIAIVVRG